ncbi:hypothetical protein OSB04_009362 [Centaurea solstitialis]|uniref:Uncharacterized protein n=1 Tax=Centaurea solstitialis TaxID=347529 RepID=A0AA38TD18_9ASTR|nr:hypothetical protein OSB04_009362 [Centaurea solstitialis]
MAQPDYSIGSSSSTDTDEDWERDAQMFAMFVQQATTSSSIPRSRAPNIDRGRVEANARLMADYFCDYPTYTDDMFKRRFRMRKDLFLRIVGDLSSRYEHFQQHHKSMTRWGTRVLLQYKSVRRQLEVYGKLYLRKPSYEDVQQLYAVHEERQGFPGMLGSLDCMHWDWENCPVAWQD